MRRGLIWLYTTLLFPIVCPTIAGRRKVCGAIAILWTACSLTLILVRVFLADKRRPAHQAPQTSASANWTLHSDRTYGEVEVPFTLHKGQIFVQADFAGVPLTCLVDTGVRDIVMQNADVPHLYSNGIVNYFGSNGGSYRAEWVTLSHIRLGDYELSQPTAVSWPLSAPAFGYTLEGFPIFATLGNRAFKDIVLTIDYGQRKLILHRPDYDITRQPHDLGSCLLDYTPGGNNVAWAPEYLSVGSRIEGHPINLVLDTGHCGASILLAPEFRELLEVPQGTMPQWNYNISGKSVTEVTRPVRWSLNNIKGECPGWIMAMRPEWQALAGYEVLRNYRLTIDYTRRKLLLEPNAGATTTATLP